MPSRTRFAKKFANQSVEGGLPKYMAPLRNIFDKTLDERIRLARKMFHEGASQAAIAKAIGYASAGACRNFLIKHGMRPSQRGGHGQGLPPKMEVSKKDLAKPYRAPLAKKPVTLARVWGKPKETKREKMRITMPKWGEEARKQRAGGMSIPDIATYHKVSQSRVSQVTGKNWEAHMEKEKLGVKARKGKSISEFAPKKEPKKEPKPEGAPPVADRQFERFYLKDPSDRRNAVVIRCGREGCGHISVFKKYGIINPVHAAKTFRSDGWSIGAGPRADRCPECMANLGNHKVNETTVAKVAPIEVPAKTVEQTLGISPEQRKPATPSISLIPVDEVMAEVRADVESLKHGVETLAESVIAIAPMSRMDRRTIFAKLNDNVYGDEATGYLGNWTDGKVAADLGVPVQWVAEVREAEFGPATNENQKRIEELRALKATIESMTEEVMGSIQAAEDAIKVFDDRATALESIVEKFRILMGKIPS